MGALRAHDAHGVHEVSDTGPVGLVVQLVFAIGAPAQEFDSIPVLWRTKIRPRLLHVETGEQIQLQTVGRIPESHRSYHEG